MTSVYVHPEIIDVDSFTGNLEVMTTATPISVHAAYLATSNLDIHIQNTSTDSSDPTFVITNAAATAYDSATLASAITSSMATMGYTGSVTDANLSFKDSGLTTNLAGESYDGSSFTLEHEVRKALASYIVNHTSLALTDSIDGSSAASNLNADTNIASTLVTAMTTATSSDDNVPLKTYFQTIMNNTDSNDVVGGTSGYSVAVFIVKCAASLSVDSTDTTGIDVTNYDALASITEGSFGNDGTISTTNVGGDYYAALCFPIGA